VRYTYAFQTLPDPRRVPAIPFKNLNFLSVNIQPQDIQTRASKLDRQRQTYITNTYNGDFHANGINVMVALRSRSRPASRQTHRSFHCIHHLVEIEDLLRTYKGGPCPKKLLFKAKRAGFSDRQLGSYPVALSFVTSLAIRDTALRSIRTIWREELRRVLPQKVSREWNTEPLQL
jgi:hypothetical protein